MHIFFENLRSQELRKRKMEMERISRQFQRGLLCSPFFTLERKENWKCQHLSIFFSQFHSISLVVNHVKMQIWPGTDDFSLDEAWKFLRIEIRNLFLMRAKRATDAFNTVEWRLNAQKIWFLTTYIVRALKSPQKFRTPSSANFLGSWHISGFKSKSCYK